MAARPCKRAAASGHEPQSLSLEPPPVQRRQRATEYGGACTVDSLLLKKTTGLVFITRPFRVLRGGIEEFIEAAQRAAGGVRNFHKGDQSHALVRRGACPGADGVAGGGVVGAKKGDQLDRGFNQLGPCFGFGDGFAFVTKALDVEGDGFADVLLYGVAGLARGDAPRKVRNKGGEIIGAFFEDNGVFHFCSRMSACLRILFHVPGGRS